jgi:hypothetical protein
MVELAGGILQDRDGSYDLPLVRYPDTPFFGGYCYLAGRYRVSVHENLRQEGARCIEEGLLDLAFAERIVCEQILHEPCSSGWRESPSMRMIAGRERQN